ncbi:MULTISPECIES: DNA cytosine methyltransferase [Bacillus]|uniref:DNA cytosine methyltransferase n=1 Tax=Bacillus TaxID=1386 RepID=UPI0005DB1C8E|nr:DNA cytosine methyltransferase [Bacillus mycoides]KIV69703.1 DNA-cytosine methyltransferase [Bacillus mycoides]
MLGNTKNVSFNFPTGISAVVTPRDAIGNLHSPDTIKSREKVLGTFPNHTATWTSPTPERILDLIANPKPNQFNGVRKLSWDQPSYTITSHIAKDGREFIHPQENRRLTVRECLRLMSVPDTYVIPPHIPLSQQYTLVGNGHSILSS